MKKILALCLLLLLLGISRGQNTTNSTTTTANSTGTPVNTTSAGDNSTVNSTSSTNSTTNSTTNPDNSTSNTTVNTTTNSTVNGTATSNSTVNETTNSTDNGTAVTTNTTVNSTNTTDNGTGIVNSTTNTTTNTTTVPSDNSTNATNTTTGPSNNNSTSNTSINSLPGGVAVNVSNSSTFPNSTVNDSTGSNVTSCDTTCATCSVSNDNKSCTSCQGDSFLIDGQCICQGTNTANCNSQLSVFNGSHLYFLMENFTQNTISNWGNGTILNCDNDLPMLQISWLDPSTATKANIPLANALQPHEIVMVSFQINVLLAPFGHINVNISYDNNTLVRSYNTSSLSQGHLPLQTCFQAGNIQYYQENIVNWTFSSSSAIPNITFHISGDGASTVGLRNFVIQVANCSAACPGMCSGPGEYQCLSCPDGSTPIYGNCLCDNNVTVNGNDTTNVTVVNLTNVTVVNSTNTTTNVNGTVNTTNTTNTTVITSPNGVCLAYNESGCPVGCSKCSYVNGATECFSCLSNFHMVVFRNITGQWTGVCVPNNTNVNWNMVSPPLCDPTCLQCFGATKYQCSSCADNSAIVSDGSVGICAGNASLPNNGTNTTTNTTTTNTTTVNGTDGSNITNTTTNTTTVNSTNGTNSSDLDLGNVDNSTNCTGVNCTNATNTTTNSTLNTTVSGANGTNTTTQTNTTTNTTNGTIPGTDIILVNNTAVGATGANTTNTTVVNTTNTTTNGTGTNTTTNVTIINSTNSTNSSLNPLVDANGLYWMTNLPACAANMSTSNATCDILNQNYIEDLTFGHFSKYFSPLHYLYIEATSTQDLCFTCLDVNLTVNSVNGSVFPVKYDALSAPMTGAVKFIFMSNFTIDDVNSWGCNSGVAAGNITVLWCEMSLWFTSLDQQVAIQSYNFTFISYLTYGLNVLTNLSTVTSVTDVNKIPTRCISGTCAVNMSATAGLTLCNDSNCTAPRSSNVFATGAPLIIRQSLDDLPGFSLSLNKVAINLLLTNGSFLMDATNVSTQTQGLGQATYTIPLNQCTNCSGNIMVLIQSNVVSYTGGRRRLTNAKKSLFEGLNRKTQVNIVIDSPSHLPESSKLTMICLIIGALASLVLIAVILSSKKAKNHEKLQETVAPSSPSSIEVDPNMPIRV